MATPPSTPTKINPAPTSNVTIVTPDRGAGANMSPIQNKIAIKRPAATNTPSELPSADQVLNDTNLLIRMFTVLLPVTLLHKHPETNAEFIPPRPTISPKTKWSVRSICKVIATVAMTTKSIKHACDEGNVFRVLMDPIYEMLNYKDDARALLESGKENGVSYLRTFANELTRTIVLQRCVRMFSGEGLVMGGMALHTYLMQRLPLMRALDVNDELLKVNTWRSDIDVFIPDTFTGDDRVEMIATTIWVFYMITGAAVQVRCNGRRCDLQFDHVNPTGNDRLQFVGGYRREDTGTNSRSIQNLVMQLIQLRAALEAHPSIARDHTSPYATGGGGDVITIDTSFTGNSHHFNTVQLIFYNRNTLVGRTYPELTVGPPPGDFDRYSCLCDMGYQNRAARKAIELCLRFDISVCMCFVGFNTKLWKIEARAADILVENDIESGIINLTQVFCANAMKFRPTGRCSYYSARDMIHRALTRVEKYKVRGFKVNELRVFD